MLIAAIALISSYQVIPMRVVWRKPIPDRSEGTVAFNDTAAFVLGRTGTLLAHDLKTGGLKSSRTLGKLTTAVATLGNDAVFVISDGFVYRLKAADLAIEWKSEKPIDLAQMGVAMTAGDGTVAVKRLRGISLFSASDGKSITRQWTAGAGSPTSPPVYTEAGVLFMSGALTLLNYKQDKPVWTAKVGQATGSQVPFYDGTHVFVTTGDSISKVEASSGKIVWSVKNGGISPVVCGNVVVVGGNGYDAADGTKLWSIPKLAALASVKLTDDKVGILFHRANAVFVGVFSTIDGEQFQESIQLASTHIHGTPRLHLTKQGTIIGHYGSSVFCLGSGAN